MSEINSKRISTNVKKKSLPVTDVGLQKGQPTKQTLRSLPRGSRPSGSCRPQDGAEEGSHPKAPEELTGSPFILGGALTLSSTLNIHVPPCADLPRWSKPPAPPFSRCLGKHGRAFWARPAGRDTAITTGGRKEKVPFLFSLPILPPASEAWSRSGQAKGPHPNPGLEVLWELGPAAET